MSIPEIAQITTANAQNTFVSEIAQIMTANAQSTCVYGDKAASECVSYDDDLVPEWREEEQRCGVVPPGEQAARLDKTTAGSSSLAGSLCPGLPDPRWRPELFGDEPHLEPGGQLPAFLILGGGRSTSATAHLCCPARVAMEGRPL